MRVNVPTFRNRSPPTPSPKLVSVMIPEPFFISRVPAVMYTFPPGSGPNVCVVIVDPSRLKLPVVIATSPPRPAPDVDEVIDAPLVRVTSGEGWSPGEI